MSTTINTSPQLNPSKTPFITAYSQKIKTPIIFQENSPFTDQSAKDECDINTIMSRYAATGELPQLNQVAPQYLDVTQEDFQTHMQIVAEAKQLFDALPSKIRERFGHDPAAFLGFTSDPENRPELARMGLLTPEATQTILNPISPPAASQAASDAIND